MKKKSNMKKKIISILGTCLVFVAVFAVRSFLMDTSRDALDDYENEKYSSKIIGVWENSKANKEETVMNILDNISLSEGEKEIVKDIELLYTIKYEFKDDGTFSYYFDKEKTIENIKKYFENVFKTLYENKSKISGYYKEKYNLNINKMSLDEFLQAEAKLYKVDSFNELPGYLMEKTINTDAYGLVQEGTYTVTSNRININDTLNHDEFYITYSLKNDSLILTYSNGTSTYKRVS